MKRLICFHCVLPAYSVQLTDCTPLKCSKLRFELSIMTVEIQTIKLEKDRRVE